MINFVAQLENAYVSENGMKNMFKELDIDGDKRVSKAEIQEYAKRKESFAVNQNMHKLQEDKRNMEYVENVFNVIGIIFVCGPKVIHKAYFKHLILRLYMAVCNSYCLL